MKETYKSKKLLIEIAKKPNTKLSNNLISRS